MVCKKGKWKIQKEKSANFCLKAKKKKKKDNKNMPTMLQNTNDLICSLSYVNMEKRLQDIVNIRNRLMYSDALLWFVGTSDLNLS